MWTVIDKRTGKKICDCAQEVDAIMMLLLGDEKRIYTTSQNAKSVRQNILYENLNI
jgi:hypothetical protein